jgi:hypothetical protein
MENDQRTKISELYGHLDLPIVEVLNIPVDSCLMDAGLIELLTDGINGTLKRVYKI